MTNYDLLNKIIESAGSKFISVCFTKVNGDERQLTFNPKQVGEVKGTGSKCQDPNIFRIVDVTLNQWRSFDARRCISVKVNGNLIKLNQEVK